MAPENDSVFRFGDYILFRSLFSAAHGSERLAGALRPGMTGIVVSSAHDGSTSVSLRDLSRPLADRVETVDLIIAAIPWPTQPSWLSGKELGGPAWGGDRPGVRLLASHLKSLAEVADCLPVGDGVAALEAAILLGSAVYQPGRIDMDEDESGRKADAIRLIDMRLMDPDLTIEGLAAELGVSRATLFRDFGLENGVKAHIRTRRLALARRALHERSGRRPSIAEIAHAYGFSSESHFSRAYRQTYGHAPGSTAAKARPRPHGSTEPELPERTGSPTASTGKKR